MRRILTSERFDVVHIHEPLMPFLGATASWFSPWPPVAHSTPTAITSTPGYLGFQTRIHPHSRQTRWPHRRFQRRQSIRLQILPRQLHHHPNGIDVPRFENLGQTQRIQRRRHKPCLRRPRWRKRKGLRFLLGAVQHPEVALPQPPPNRRRRRRPQTANLSNDGRTRHRRRHLRRPLPTRNSRLLPARRRILRSQHLDTRVSA